MSAAAPNPKDLLILAAVGIGVYWLMSRRAVAAVPASGGVTNPNLANNTANLVANAVGSLARYFNGGTTPGTYDGRAAMPWNTSTGGGSANNPSAYVASSAVDGVAANVPNYSTYDAVDMGSATGDDLSTFY